MGITEYEELAFMMLSKLHFYMWPLPVKWDFKLSKLVSNKPNWKLIPFLISLLYIWLFGWSFIGTTIYVGYIHQRKGFIKITWAIFISCWIICTSFCLAVYLGNSYAKAVISAFNELLQLADDICIDYPDKRRDDLENRKATSFDKFMFAGVFIPFASFVPYGITLSALLSDLDCPHYILEEILEAPEYRNGPTIIFKLVFRFISVLILDLEIVRATTFGLCCSLVALRRVYIVAVCLLVNVHDFRGFLKYYIRLCMIFKKVERVLNVLLYLLLTISFWGLVMSCWVCVRLDPEEITILIYACFAVIMLVLLVGHNFLLPLLCYVTDMSELIVKVHMHRAKFSLARFPFRRYVANLGRVRATMPYRLKYGIYGFIRKSFLPGYFELIVERVFDAIMIK